jgi:hypothetical protein
VWAAVPIAPFLNGQAFDPETIETMSAALAEACQALRLMEKDDAAVQLLALRIIDRARDGIHDTRVLKDAALRGFLPP